MADELGDWAVDTNERIAADMVELTLAETDESGVNAFVAYFPPQTARDIARALEQQADWLESL